MAFSKKIYFAIFHNSTNSKCTRLVKPYFKELLELKDSEVIIGMRHICNLPMFIACQFRPPNFFRGCFNVFINIVCENLLSYSISELLAK